MVFVRIDTIDTILWSFKPGGLSSYLYPQIHQVHQKVQLELKTRPSTPSTSRGAHPRTMADLSSPDTSSRKWTWLPNCGVTRSSVRPPRPLSAVWNNTRSTSLELLLRILWVTASLDPSLRSQSQENRCQTLTTMNSVSWIFLFYGHFFYLLNSLN